MKKKTFKVKGYIKKWVVCPDCMGEQKSRCCYCKDKKSKECPDCCPPCARCNGNGGWHEII